MNYIFQKLRILLFGTDYKNAATELTSAKTTSATETTFAAAGLSTFTGLES